MVDIVKLWTCDQCGITCIREHSGLPEGWVCLKGYITHACDSCKNNLTDDQKRRVGKSGKFAKH